jgi:hypothetical protein
VVIQLILSILVGFGRAMRPCAMHSGLFRHAFTSGRCAPSHRSFAAPLLIIYRENPRKITRLGENPR